MKKSLSCSLWASTSISHVLHPGPVKLSKSCASPQAWEHTQLPPAQDQSIPIMVQAPGKSGRGRCVIAHWMGDQWLMSPSPWEMGASCWVVDYFRWCAHCLLLLDTRVPSGTSDKLRDFFQPPPERKTVFRDFKISAISITVRIGLLLGFSSKDYI